MSSWKVGIEGTGDAISEYGLLLSIKRKGARRTHGEDVPESTGRTARAVRSVELRSSLATESLTLLLLLAVVVVVASGKLLGEVDKVIHFCVCVFGL